MEWGPPQRSSFMQRYHDIVRKSGGNKAWPQPHKLALSPDHSVSVCNVEKLVVGLTTRLAINVLSLANIYFARSTHYTLQWLPYPLNNTGIFFCHVV